MRSLLAVVLAMTWVSFGVQAETHIPAGSVSGTWTLAGSPYIIEGNIVVQSTASLTIQPGVTVIQNRYSRFRIEGQLLAIGTPSDSIRFQAADTSSGSEALDFLNTNLSAQDSSKLDYCEISYGVASASPDFYMHGGGLFIQNSSRLRVSHCYIHHCRTKDVIGANGQNATTPGGAGGAGDSGSAGHGGAVYCDNSDIMLCFNKISYNSTGQGWGGSGGDGGASSAGSGGVGGPAGTGTGGNGGAIYANNSSPIFMDNKFYYNFTGAGHGGEGGWGGDANVWYMLFAQGGAGGAGGAGTGGSGAAIYAVSSQCTIQNNLFYGNHPGYGFGGNGGHGGYAGGYGYQYAYGGSGGNGGSGLGGNGLVSAAVSPSTLTLANCTLSGQNLIGEGHGGAGGPGGAGGSAPGAPGSPGQGLNGTKVVYGETVNIINSIIWNNADPGISSGTTVTYSCIQGGFPGLGNISTNPLFAAGSEGAYYLSQIASGQTANSPCLDAGNPVSSMIIGTTRTDQVQDAGILDMGYHYSTGLSAPDLDVTLTPLNPPIVIPANGGSFDFNASVTRMVGPQAPFTVWARIKNPDGSYTNPTLGPVQINPPVAFTVMRQRTQNVPASWAAGEYTYLGYANITFEYPAIDSSSFTFTKSTASNGGPWITEAFCTGELFPGEEIVANQTVPLQYGIVNVSPNPFNPTTVLRFELPEACNVRLEVFDVRGREAGAVGIGESDLQYSAGTHEIIFDGSGLPSGVYLYRLEVSGSGTSPTTVTGKMVLMK